MDKLLLRRQGMLCFAGEQTEESKRRGTTDGVGLAVREPIVARMNKGDVAVDCISARLIKVRIQLKGNLTVCLLL